MGKNRYNCYFAVLACCLCILLALFLAGCTPTGQQAQTPSGSEPADPGVTESAPPSEAPPEEIVETAIEYHWDDGERNRVDVRMPKLRDDLPNAAQLNQTILADYPVVTEAKDINDWQTAEGYEYSWGKYDYSVANFDGVYAINIFDTTSSAYGSYYPMKYVRSYYYDANTGEILTVEQFLDRIGYSEDDIVRAYIEDQCPAYTPDQISFQHLFFYFDEYHVLHFIFASVSIRPE